MKKLLFNLALLPAIAVAAFVTLHVLRTARDDHEPAPAPQNDVSATSTSEFDTFAGADRCRECHEEIYEFHSNSAHAHTFSVTGKSNVARGLCGKSVSAVSGSDVFRYECDAEGVMVGIPERFPGRMFPLDFALGSGKHAMTFVTLLPDGDETVLVEHRMTWFAGQQELGLTPGHEDVVPTHGTEFFGKVFRGEDMKRCISCHTTTAAISDGVVHDFISGVQCEKCHGAGREHCSKAEAGQIGPSKMQIRSAWTAEEEIRMCGECHRLPKDVTSERLKKYPPSLVRFQPIGLLQSRCYLESPNSLKCTTCHDPHRDVQAFSPDAQVSICLKCHSSTAGTTCSAGEASRCVDCHMPPVELLPGISFHDHWIRIRDGSQDHRSPPSETERPDISGSASL